MSRRGIPPPAADLNAAYWAREDAILEEAEQFRQRLREDGISEGAVVTLGALAERLIRLEKGRKLDGR